MDDELMAWIVAIVGSITFYSLFLLLSIIIY